MAFGGYLKQSTAVDVLIGPFLDDSDGKTAETGLTISQADVKLSKNGQTLAQKNDNTAAAHDSDGYYNCELDATDTNTLGQLTLIVHESGALPIRHDYQIVTSNWFDTMCSTDQLDVNTTNIEGTDATDQIKTQVVAALATDTYAEPGQEAPTATTTLATKISYLFKFMRNKIETTATTISVYDDAGSTVDQKSTISDNGTTFTRGEFGTGP